MIIRRSITLSLIAVFLAATFISADVSPAEPEVPETKTRSPENPVRLRITILVQELNSFAERRSHQSSPQGFSDTTIYGMLLSLLVCSMSLVAAPYASLTSSAKDFIFLEIPLAIAIIISSAFAVYTYYQKIQTRLVRDILASIAGIFSSGILLSVMLLGGSPSTGTTERLITGLFVILGVALPAAMLWCRKKHFARLGLGGASLGIIFVMLATNVFLQYHLIRPGAYALMAVLAMGFTHEIASYLIGSLTLDDKALQPGKAGEKEDPETAEKRKNFDRCMLVVFAALAVLCVLSFAIPESFSVASQYNSLAQYIGGKFNGTQSGAAPPPAEPAASNATAPNPIATDTTTLNTTAPNPVVADKTILDTTAADAAASEPTASGEGIPDQQVADGKDGESGSFLSGWGWSKFPKIV